MFVVCLFGGANNHCAQAKPLTIKQQVLQSQLHPESNSRSPSPQLLTHVEEQKALRKETIAAFQTDGAGVDEGEDEDDFLVPREKTKDELEREEEEYKEFLEREVGEDLDNLITVEEGRMLAADEHVEEIVEGEEKSKKKKSKKSKGKEKAKESGKSKQDEDQEFLMKYV